MTSILDEYLSTYKKYEEKYGKGRAIPIMQVGSFFELYATNSEGPDLEKIASLLNVVCTRKDKSVKQISKSNPLLVGFPTQALHKFLGILMNHGYTVIVIEQVTKPPNPKRGITGIYSPGTAIEHVNSSDSNNIICIYIEYEQQLNGKSLPCCGLSSIDLTTGKSQIYEVCSTSDDANYALDEAYRFILATNPKEIVLYFKPTTKLNQINMSEDKLVEYLELPENKLFKKGIPLAHTLKPNYKNEVLGKAFTNLSTTPLEELELAMLSYASASFVFLINYAYDHNINIINNISFPEHFVNDKYLILGNDAVRQLNILETDYLDVPNKKIRSVFDVVDNTHTALGRRYLKNRLSYPLVAEKELNRCYDDIEFVLEQNTYLIIQTFLREICDIERLERKMSLLLLQPSEMADFINSYKSVSCIFDQLLEKITKPIKNKKQNKTKQLKLSKFSKQPKESINISTETSNETSNETTNETTIENKLIKNTMLPKNKFIKQLEQFLEQTSKIFNLDELKIQNLSDIKKSFFAEGICKEADEIEKKINFGVNFMTNLSKVLSELISDKVYLKKNDRDGYYFQLTKPRAAILKKKLETNPIINVEGYEFDSKHLEFKNETKNAIKINLSSVEDKSDEIEGFKNKLYEIVITAYKNQLTLMYSEYHELFNEINNFVSYIDFITSNAKAAKEYNYVRPNIKKQAYSGQTDSENNSQTNQAHSYINTKDLRHPIIERIIDHEYIPHDVSLGTEMKGMLIYGLNSAGKSSLMKAVGISLIMAQSGMFVPAKEYNFYPYKSCFTRITGNDNIFKGLSSFALEMTELGSILSRSGPNTLVIGDEICRGTEHVSGNSIVATSIIHLANSETSFIFATHLHELATIPEVKELENVKMFHIGVSYDEKTDTIIYNRKLLEGTGEPIYGITVAKYIIKDANFINTANKIKNQLLKREEDIISNKKSKYNSEIFVYECQLCKKRNTKGYVSELETHHINFQKDCENGFVKNKQHIQKDAKSNLIVVCNKCHDKIHNGELSVEGYVMTSKGKQILSKTNN